MYYIVTLVLRNDTQRLFKVYNGGLKSAVKALRKIYPNMRKHDGSEYCYATDAGMREFLVINERDIPGKVGKNIYVVTRAEMFQPEWVYKAFAGFKIAEDALRKEFPQMRKDSGDTHFSSYKENSSGGNGLLFIHEMPVE